MSRSPVNDDSSPSLVNRLVTAIMAPIFFNLSLLIVWAMFFRKTHFLSRPLRHGIPLSGEELLWLFVGLPALLGFGLGAGRSITMLGHLFYTNRGFEQNPLITLGLWIGLFFCAYLLAGAFSV